MIRPVTIVAAAMACGSGLFLYQSKHGAQVLDKQIEHTVRETAALREQSRLLAAEWTMLNDPERLRQFSDTYLSLKPIAPTQFTSMADLDSRLPPPRPVGQDSAPPNSQDGVPVAAEPAPADAPVAAVAVHPAQEFADDARSAPRLPEHKITLTRPVAADAPPPRAIAAVDQHPAPTDSRAAEPRPAEPRAPRPQDARATQDNRTVEARPMQESRPAQEQRPVRDVRLAQDVRPVQDVRPALAARPAELRPPPAQRTAAFVPRPQSGGAPPLQAEPYGGSLLGMARGPAPAPEPRPTPVNATNWYNAN